MTQTKKIWIIIAVLVLLSVVTLLFFTINQPPPANEFSLNDPSIIAITEGAQGEINGLEIGVTFVDSNSAGISIVEAGNTEAAAQNSILEEQESISFGNQTVSLLDAVPNERSAILQVQENN